MSFNVKFINICYLMLVNLENRIIKKSVFRKVLGIGQGIRLIFRNGGWVSMRGLGVVLVRFRNMEDLVVYQLSSYQTLVDFA